MAGELSQQAKQVFNEQKSQTASLFDKFSDLIGVQKKGNTEARNAVAKLATQVQFTQELINNNRKKIEKVAENDSEVAQFLKDFDNQNFALLDEVKNTIAQGQDVDAKTGKELLAIFTGVQDNLGKLKLDGLEANLGSVVDQLQGVVMDGNLSRDVQREFVNDFINVLQEQKDLDETAQSALELLVEEQKKGLNFSQEQSETLSDIFQFFEESKIGTMKEQGTLDDLNRKFSSFLVNQEEIEAALEEQKFDGEALSDLLKEGLDSEIGTGITDILLGALGLPGLATALKGAGDFAGKAKKLIFGGFDKIFGKSGFISKVFGKGGFIGKVAGKFGKVFGTVTKVFGNVSKVAGPVLKSAKFLKAIPVVGTVIAAISGIFDAVSGFFNADEISGKAEEFVTTGDRIQASISAFFSGLTFGLVEAKTIFEGIDKGIDFLFGDDGMFSSIENFFKGLFEISPIGMITSLTDRLLGGTGEIFGEDGVFAKLLDGLDEFGNMISDSWDKLTNFISDFDFTSFLPDSVAKFFSDDETEKPKEVDSGEGGFFDRVGDFFSDDTSTPPPTGASIQQTESTDFGNQASVALNREDTLEAERRNGGNNGQPQVIPVPVGNQPASVSPPKRTQVDDLQLSAINVGLLD